MLVSQQFNCASKIHSRCFGIMGGHGNFAFNLVGSKAELGYVFLSLRL
jgi:hypothetical protein